MWKASDTVRYVLDKQTGKLYITPQFSTQMQPIDIQLVDWVEK